MLANSMSVFQKSGLIATLGTAVLEATCTPKISMSTLEQHIVTCLSIWLQGTSSRSALRPCAWPPEESNSARTWSWFHSLGLHSMFSRVARLCKPCSSQMYDQHQTLDSKLHVVDDTKIAGCYTLMIQFRCFGNGLNNKSRILCKKWLHAKRLQK